MGVAVVIIEEEQGETLEDINIQSKIGNTEKEVEQQRNGRYPPSPPPHPHPQYLKIIRLKIFRLYSLLVILQRARDNLLVGNVYN